MICQMVTSAYPFGTCGTQGYSPSAHFIHKQIQDRYNELESPEFYFSIKKKVLPELEEVYSNSQKRGWDGYDAQPVRVETYFHVISFLESLPGVLPIPTVGVESDGNITLEWYKSPQRLLSVSVSPFGELHYAALIGPKKSYGTETFSGEIPHEILDLMRRVIPK